jgi:hypothetical protein
MPYNLAQPYSRSFKGPIDNSLVFQTTQARIDWLASAAGIAIGYSGMIVSDLETNKAYMLSSNNTWIEITSSNAVETTGNQTVSGVKTFANRPIFSSGLSVSGVDASSNSGLFLPVFTGNPSSSQQTLFTRTPSQFKSDIGLGNVDNISIAGYSRAGIDSRTSFPPETHNITSHTGTNWQVFYTNGSNQVVGLGLGSSGQVLKSNGTTAAPSWGTDNDTIYTHPTNGANTTITAANKKVLSAITVDSLGHVTAVSGKDLTEDDIPTLGQGKITNLTTDLSNKLSLSGGTMTGSLTLSGNPTETNHAATKGYVDAVKQGLDIKDSVRVATTANLAVTSTDSNVLTAQTNGTSLNTIDGKLLVVGNRILVKNQDGSSGSASASYNGIYTVTQLGTASLPLVLTRAVDADNGNVEVNSGMFTFVEEGDTNADTGWVLTNDGSITINSTPLTFSQFSAAGQIYDGSGLLKIGNTLHIGQGDGISVLDNSVAVNSTVLRTSGVQTITGNKDFGNYLLIKPTKNAEASFFPAFLTEPTTEAGSQLLYYMTKNELVTALSFETPDTAGFVNTSTAQTISGEKTFQESAYFNHGHKVFLNVGGATQPIGGINLLNSTTNTINFNMAGTSGPPTRGDVFASGTKIVLRPSPASVASQFPPVAIGCNTQSLWSVVPSGGFNYEWYAGSTNIATLSGNGTFETTTLKSTNLYINNTEIIATAAELNLLSSASDKDILIGNGTDFTKQNLITALSGAIISQSGLTISSNASNLIINHNLSSATSTSNSNPNVVQNILLDNYGHITGISSLDLDTIYLTSSDLNTQISFVSGIGSSYANDTLTVFHSGGNPELPAGTYGGNGIKTIVLDGYGHITNVTTPSSAYIASGDLCTAIRDCTIDGGTY